MIEETTHYCGYDRAIKDILDLLDKITTESSHPDEIFLRLSLRNLMTTIGQHYSGVRALKSDIKKAQDTPEYRRSQLRLITKADT